MREAAAKLGVTSHIVRRMIQDGILPVAQVVPGAPWQIRAEDLENDDVINALRQKGRPRHIVSRDQLSMFPDT
ncbi:helix-turn-helix domain-containing protein [Paenirhodobacter sp.]|uniref:helix-turn-helix domain-containing protein n=1 Tax=Paenirhodobacter sp. TaxID=1965326 RepID=UPI003B4078AC